MNSKLSQQEFNIMMNNYVQELLKSSGLAGRSFPHGAEIKVRPVLNASGDRQLCLVLEPKSEVGWSISESGNISYEERVNYSAIAFGQAINVLVTQEQSERLSKFFEELREDGYKDPMNHSYKVVEDILSLIPSSQRSTYHEHPIVAAAEFYPVYSNRTENNKG